jgi:hypothetical protein
MDREDAAGLSPADLAALRVLLARLLGYPPEAPAVARFVRWVSRLAGRYTRIQARDPAWDGLVQLAIRRGEPETCASFRRDSREEDAA